MLTETERKKVLVFLRYFCTVGILPLEINANSWELRPGVQSPWKKLASIVSFGIYLTHSLYKILSLVYVFVFLQEETPLYQLIIHMIVAASSAVLSLWYYLLYFKHPGINATFVMMTLTATVTDGDTKRFNGETEKQWHHRLMEYSLQDLIAVSLPYMGILGVPVISISYLYDPTMKLLLYAMLPTTWQSWAWFWVFFTEEVHLLTIWVVIAIPAWQLQVIGLDLANTELQNIFSRILKRNSLTAAQMEQACRSLRCLQLYLKFLNLVNRDLIFTWKLLSIGVGIVSGYAAIAHFLDYPIFGIMYYVIFSDTTLIYVVIYGKGFKIPEMFIKAKNLIRSHANRCGGSVRHKNVERKLLSIPAVGIEVGEFHTLERMSSPAYLDYVLTNVVSMLVAFG